MSLTKSCARCTGKTVSGTQCKNRACTTGPYCWQHLRKEEFLRVKPSTIKGAGMGLFADKPGAKPGEVIFSNGKKTHPGDDRNGVIADYGQVHKNYLNEAQIKKAKNTDYAVQMIHGGSTYYLNPTKTNDGVAIRANDRGMGKDGWDEKRAREKNQAVLQQTNTHTIENPKPDHIKSGNKALSHVIVPRLVVANGRPGGKDRVIKQGEEIFTHYTGSKNQDAGGYWKERGKDGKVKSKGNAKTKSQAAERAARAKKRRRDLEDRDKDYNPSKRARK